MGNTTVYTLDLDTSKLVSKYRSAISDMEKAGVSTDITKGLTTALDKLEGEYKKLAEAGAAGFTNSKEIEAFNKKIEKLMGSFRGFESSLGGVTTQIGEVSKASDKAKQKLENAFTKLGFKNAAEQMTKIANATNKEAELSEIVEKEIKDRAAAVEELKKKYEEAAEAAKQASESASGAGLKANISAKSDTKRTWKQGDNKASDEKRAEIVAQAEEIAKAAASAEDAWSKFSAYVASDKSVKEAFNSVALGGGQVEAQIKAMYESYQSAAPAIQAAEQAQAELNTATQSFNQIATTARDGSISPNTKALKQLESATDGVEESQKQVGKVMQDSKADAEALANAQNKSAQAADGVAGSAEQERASVSQMGQGLAETAKQAEKTTSAFEQLKNRILTFFSVTSMFTALRNQIKQTYEDVKNLDKSFASIAMVTENSVQGMWESYNDYADMASELGQKTNDVIQASALFYQQGLDQAEALSLTTDTMKLATLAGNDYQTATQEMTSALRGFKMEMDEGSHVTDVYSELAAHAAASVDDIAQAMSRTASIANSAGMSFENTSAFLTQMIETTQESAENIGTSLKTIIARFTELKENVAGTADSEFEDLDYNKVDKALKSVGVSLKDTNGQFRDLDDVFLDLSAKWDTLDRNTQRYVATIAAGSRQQSRFIAMMDNYDRTVELMELAGDAEGKADEQFEKYADTMEYKLNQLSTTWEQFRVNLLNSDMFKSLIDGVNEFVSAINSIDFSKFSGKIKIIDFAVMIVGLKNFIKVFITNMTNLTKNVQKIGKQIGEKLTNSIKTAVAKKSKTLNQVLQLKPELILKDLEQGVNRAQQRLNEFSKSPALHMYLDVSAPNENEGAYAYLARLKKEGKLTSEELVALRNELKELGGGNATEGLAKLGDQAESYKKALQDVTDAEAKLKAEQELQAKASQYSAQAMSTLSGMASAGVTAIGGLITGTMSAKQAFLSVASAVGSLIIQMTLQIASEKILAAMKAKTAAAAAAKAGSETAETVATTAQTGANTALAASEYLVLGPLLLIILAVGAAIVAIVGIIAIISSVVKKNKEAADTTLQYKNALEELNKEKAKVSESKEELKNLEDSRDNVEDMVEEYKELQKKQRKTTEDYERMEELSGEIKDNYPEIVASTDEQTGLIQIANNAYDNLLTSMDSEIEKQKELVELAQAGVVATQQTADLYKAMDSLNSNFDFNLSASGAGDIDLTKTILSGNYELKINDYGVVTDSNNNDNLAERMFDNFEKSLGDAFSNLNDEELVQAFNYVMGSSNELGTQFDTEMRESLNAFKKSVEEAADSLNHFDEYYEITKERVAEATADKDYDEVQQNVVAAIAASNIDKIPSFAEMKGELGITGGDKQSFVNSAEKMVKQYGELLDGEDTSEIVSAYADIYNAVQVGSWGNANSFDAVKKSLKGKQGALDALERLGITDQDSYIEYMGGKDISDSEGAEKFLTELNKELTKMALENANNYTISSKEDEDMLNQVSDFSSKLEGMTTEEIIENWDELEKTLETYDADVANTIRDQIGVSKEEAEGMANEMSEIFGKNAEGLKYTTQQLLKEINDEAFDATGSEALAKKYSNDMLDIMKNSGLDESEWAEAMSINWSNITNEEELEEARDNWIETWSNKVGTEAAEQMWDDMQESAEDWGMLDIPFDFDSFQEEIDDAMDSIESLGDSIVDVMSDMTEAGEVSFSNFKSLKDDMEELGLSVYDYITIDDDGTITATEEQLEEIYQAQIDAQKEKLLEQKNELEIEKSNLEIQLSQLDEQIAAVESGDQFVDTLGDVNNQSAAIYENWNRIAKAVYMANNNGSADGYEDLGAATKTYIKHGNEDEVLEALKNQRTALQSQVDLYTENLDKITDEYDNFGKYSAAMLKDHNTDLAEATDRTAELEELEENLADATEDLADAQQDYADQLEVVAEKQETLNEKLEAYNDLLYGSDNRKSTLDYLYNYDEAINSFNDEISRAQDLLSDATSVEEATAALERYGNATHNLIAEETAKQEVLKAGLSNIEDMIMNGGTSYQNKETGETIDVNFGDYVKIDERTGKAVLDQRLLNEAQFGDDWKDYLEEQVSNYNKYSEDLLTSEDNVRKAEKAMEDLRKSALKSYAAMETEIAEALKEQYQNEVDALKEKYDSMKEADDDYLSALEDAINKQRELRDRENAWEDLAEQEKKLSLMQRDTSGANQVEVAKLEDEVQQTREEMLDEAIDNVIESLSDLYESQSELRDTEIELKEALLDNTLYWNEQAEGLAGSFESAEEYAAFLSSLSEEYSMMTLAQQQDKLNEYGDTFTDASTYMAMQAMDSASTTGDYVVDVTNVSGEEVATIVTDTAQTFTDEVTRSYNETTEAFNADLESAEQEIADARDALQEAIDKLGEYAAAAQAAAEAYALAKQEYEDYLATLGQDSNEPGGGSSGNSSGDSNSTSFDSATTYSVLTGAGVNHNALDAISHTYDGIKEVNAMLSTVGTTIKLSDEQGRQIGDDLKNQGFYLGRVGDKFRAFESESERNAWVDSNAASMKGNVKKYAEGGIVDYTGPAWVDGTVDKPEAFLNAEDTQRIGEAARILADIPWMDRDTENSTVVTNNNGGDVTVEINLNIDHISSETDIDEMLERVKQEIVDVARPAGTNTILQQQL